MARRIITEEVTENSPEAKDTRGSRIGNVLYVIFGFLLILLGFRFLFLLLGANQASGFVSFIYDITEPFVAPFYGIFPEVTYNQSYFDPATLVAMAVYSVIAWFIVRLDAAATGKA